MATSTSASVSHDATPSSSATVLMIVGSSVLAGLGILGMLYWLLTLRWLYFASVIPLVLGAYLLFTRATGPDRA